MIKHCNGRRLIKALSASNDWLASKMEVVNNLNVFPVPDGDTGFNMSLTLKAAVEATKDLKDRDLSSIAKEVGTSSVMASRGCSGVILSQFLVGLAKGFEGKKRVWCCLSISSIFTLSTSPKVAAYAFTLSGSLVWMWHLANSEEHGCG